jgi:hypothetical protein
MKFRKKDLEKNKILSQLNFNKQKQMNDLINRYIKNDKSVYELMKIKKDSINIKYEMSNRLELLLQYEYSNIEKEFTNLREYFCKLIYANYLSKVNSKEIEFNKNLTLFQVIVINYKVL